VRSLTALLIFLGCLALAANGCAPREEVQRPDEDRLYAVPDFSLVERSGRSVTRQQLMGKVWVAAFIFTRCGGPCSQVSASMARLQHDLADQPGVVLLSFSVDPEYDTPKVLQEYAGRFGADPKRWLFLTGKPETIYPLIRTGFHLVAQPNEGADRTPGQEVLHDTRLALVDDQGDIRGYFQATDPEDMGRLEEKIKTLVQERS